MSVNRKKKGDEQKTRMFQELQESLKLFHIKTTELEEALLDLRVHVKYLLFENEALKRENKALANIIMEDHDE